MTADTAVLFGAVTATLVSALTVVLAFMRPAMRWARAQLGGAAASYADHLCTGIWLSAVGAMVIAIVSMLWLATGITVTSFATMAWVFIGGGYFLHFTAWRASFQGTPQQTTQWRWFFILLTLGTGAAVTFFLLIG